MQVLRALVVLSVVVTANAQVVCRNNADVSGLPLVEQRSSASSDVLGVIVTGDGGWRALDRSIADALGRDGVDVVGLISPSYFHERKTPDEAGCALARIIRHYSVAWHKRRVVLFGYSRGAGVLPFMISRLPPIEESEVRGVALIGLDPTISFKVTVFDLFRRAPADDEIPVLPELKKLRVPVFCVYGREDDEALCPALSPALVTSVAYPGGHHPETDYHELVQRMLAIR